MLGIEEVRPLPRHCHLGMGDVVEFELVGGRGRADLIIGESLLMGAIVNRLLAATVVTAACLWAAGAASRVGQGAEMRADWRDLETWSRQVGGGQTERGLGLHLSGPSGRVMMAFVTRSTGRSAPAGDVTVQVTTGPLGNPNRVQTATLFFRGADEQGRTFTLDLSARLTVDNPAPGAQVTSGVARMRAAEFVRLSRATRATATALGLEVAIRADQLKAMRALR